MASPRLVPSTNENTGVRQSRSIISLSSEGKRSVEKDSRRSCSAENHSGPALTLSSSSSSGVPFIPARAGSPEAFASSESGGCPTLLSDEVGEAIQFLPKEQSFRGRDLSAPPIGASRASCATDSNPGSPPRFASSGSGGRPALFTDKAVPKDLPSTSGPLRSETDLMLIIGRVHLRPAKKVERGRGALRRSRSAPSSRTVSVDPRPPEQIFISAGDGFPNDPNLAMLTQNCQRPLRRLSMYTGPPPARRGRSLSISQSVVARIEAEGIVCFFSNYSVICSFRRRFILYSR